MATTSRDDPRVALARVLYETLEKLDPGIGEYIEWNALSLREKELYAFCIDALLQQRDLVVSALPSIEIEATMDRAGSEVSYRRIV